MPCWASASWPIQLRSWVSPAARPQVAPVVAFELPLEPVSGAPLVKRCLPQAS
jgi:hypothetical protein